MKLKKLSVGEKFILRTPRLTRANTALVFRVHDPDFPAYDPRKEVGANELHSPIGPNHRFRRFSPNQEVIKLKD